MLLGVRYETNMESSSNACQRYCFCRAASIREWWPCAQLISCTPQGRTRHVAARGCNSTQATRTCAGRDCARNCIDSAIAPEAPRAIASRPSQEITFGIYSTRAHMHTAQLPAVACFGFGSHASAAAAKAPSLAHHTRARSASARGRGKTWKPFHGLALMPNFPMRPHVRDAATRKPSHLRRTNGISYASGTSSSAISSFPNPATSFPGAGSLTGDAGAVGFASGCCPWLSLPAIPSPAS